MSIFDESHYQREDNADMDWENVAREPLLISSDIEYKKFRGIHLHQVLYIWNQ